MAQEELPSWLGELSQLLKEKKVFKKDFNHVLINEYEPGQGIMVRSHGQSPHTFCMSSSHVTMNARHTKMAHSTSATSPSSACRAH